MTGLVLSLFGLWSAFAQNMSIPASSHSLLSFQYRIDCQSIWEPHFPGINLMWSSKHRTYHVTLWRYRQDEKLLIPTEDLPDLKKIIIRKNPACSLKSLYFSSPIENQNFILENTPILALKKDQLLRPEKDRPIDLMYSWHSVPNFPQRKRLRFTLFYSNETVSGPGSTTKAKSIAQWGRRNDIEWIYEVETDLDESQIYRRNFHSDQTLGVGHRARHFNGKFLPQTSRPILYIKTKNQVLSDRRLKIFPQIQSRHFFSLAPRGQLHSNESREQHLLRHPWIFAINELELSKEGLRIPSLEKYTFFVIRSESSAPNLSYRTRMSPKRNWIRKNGLGLDLFQRESLIAHLTPKTESKHLPVPIFVESEKGPPLQILKAYRLEKQFESRQPFQLISIPFVKK